MIFKYPFKVFFSALSLIMLIGFNIAFAQAPHIAYSIHPASYIINKPITPLTPSNSGGKVAKNGYGALSIIAGSGAAGSADGNGEAASFSTLTGITDDASGNLYVNSNNSIRKINPQGIVSTIASAKGEALTIDAAGNLYVCDQQDNLISKVSPSGTVITFATGFNQPEGLTIDASGNLYVTDAGNNLIRKITPGGIITTFAGSGEVGKIDGSGSAASFNHPSGITIDAGGNFYVTDKLNNLVRKITAGGAVTTLAGSGVPGSQDGTGSAASFSTPLGITVDIEGNLYVADAGNNLIRRIAPDGKVITVAGNYPNASGNDAFFSYPQGIAFDHTGNAYITEHLGNTITQLGLTGYTIDEALPPNLKFDPTTGTISGTPTAISLSANYNVTAYNASGSSSTTVTIAISRDAKPVVAAPKITYPTPQVYPANSPISPLTPNTSAGGAVPVTTFGLTTTFTGTGNAGNTNGGPLNATFRFPIGDAVDAAGNLYIADQKNNLIRKATIDGTVSTLAGSGNQGQANGLGTLADFNGPTSVAVDAAGNVYVADYDNDVIRKITPGGSVSTLAGNGVPGFANGAGATASFHLPTGVAVDGAGNVYVTDNYNNMIRMITPAGVVSTLAGSGQKGSSDGTGALASFNAPQDLAVDASGNVYVTDAGNNLIRMITPAGKVTTIAGTGQKGNNNGIGTAASFNNPTGIAVDLAGNVFVADYGNNLIRMITPDGTVTTLAGSGNFGTFNNTGIVASFAGPSGLAIDASGNLFVADKYSDVIREIVTTGYYINKPLPEGLVFDNMTGIISGTPTTATPTTIYTITAYNEGGNGSFQVSITVDAAAPPLVAPPKFTYQTPQIYPVNTAITPLIPQNNGGGPVPATIFGQVSTFAGSGIQGAVNAIGAAASFSFPHDVKVDGAGNIYVADDGNYMIRMITPDGHVSTLAGTGLPGSNNGAENSATFLGPIGVAIDPAANVYVADIKNDVVRRISNAGQVTTFAGSTGIFGATNGVGTAASFNYPSGLATDAGGNIYVADPGNNMIRKITPDAVVSTLAGQQTGGANDGQGTAATFNSPEGVAVDKAGNVYVADDFNNMIRMITPGGTVTTLAGNTTAGTSNGKGTAARFNRPVGIAVDAAGNLYVGDTGNNEIRMITPQGLVITLAGNGTPGAANGIGSQASFNMPSGLSADASGNVFVADDANHLIREVVATGYTIDKTLPPGLTFDPKTGTISGTPTTASPATDYTVTGYNTGGNGSFTLNITVINLATQTITFSSPIVKTYGDPDFDPGATSTNKTIPITYASDNAAVATIVNGQIHIIGVGSSTITASQAGNSNYTAASPVSQLLTVDKAVLTITAKDQTKSYGTPNPPFGVNYEGFKYTDQPAQLISLPVLSTIATTTSPVGEYAITITGEASNNYTFNIVPGVLTITPPPVTITVPNAFTPNGDGINDVWDIKSLNDFPQCTVSVYNRYGNLVYQSKGYPKPWDGTYNGAQLPVGTYYYIIDTKNNIKPLAGPVTILR